MIDATLASCVDTRSLGLLDAFSLTLLEEAALHLGNHPEDRE